MAGILTTAGQKKFLLSLTGPFPILVSIIVTGIMLYVTGLIPEIGKWYSFNQSLRLQTDAFLQGELALTPIPYGHSGDWAWGNGMHQIWGLGVPIIRLPFEILGKAFGSFGFPDRIVFAIFYFLVAAIFWKSLDSLINPDLSIRDQFKKRIQNIPILFFGLLNPAFITMVRARFSVYEEVIAYSYLWALMLFALLLLFLNNHKSRLFLLICLLAGFSPIIRPTAIFYGTVTFLMTFYLAKHRQIKLRLIGLLLFCAGIIVLFATNYLRFNSPLEFGHKLLLSGVPVIDYVHRFDNPVAHMPLVDAVRELFSDLFFTDINTPNFLLDEKVLWGPDLPRLREFYFRPYDFLTPLLLFLSWLIVALWRCNKSNINSSLDKKTIQMGGLWSFCSFIMLFYFYSRFPVLASRYFVDFGASIVIGIIALYLCIGNLIQCKFSRNATMLNLILCVAFLGWSLYSLTHAEINFHYGHRSEIEKLVAKTAEVAQEELMRMRRTTGPLLPAEYNCRDKETKYGIPSNNEGWDMSASCTVNLVTTHFLDAPDCIAIHVEPIGGAPGWMEKIYSDKEIEVKNGLEKMRRISDVRTGFGKIITFCTDRKEIFKGDNGQQIKLISVKWSNLQRHPNLSTPPLRLIMLKKVQEHL